MVGTSSPTPIQDIPGAADPVLDKAYLEEMRGWLGASTLAGLLAGAPQSFRPALADLAGCRRSGDEEARREAAHRLAGAAGSIGAQRLAALARHCQRLGDGQCGEDLVAALEAAVEEALAALATAVG